MPTVFASSGYEAWFSGLEDRTVRARIARRIDRLAEGNPGDRKSAGGGIMELRIDFGPGYRVYDMHRGAAVVVLLAGGDKSTQDADIARARAVAAAWKG